MAEQAVKNHLNTLSDTDVKNAKAHASQAAHEDHPSFKEIQRWAGAVTGTVISSAMAWKIIKVIKNH